MKKGLKITLVVVACALVLGLVGGGIAFFATGNTAKADEYKLGNDTIKSVKAIVAERQVTSVSKETSNGTKPTVIEYKSSTVQDDLIAYTQYLRSDGGFTLTKDMDLTVPTSSVQLAKESADSDKILVMTIDYTPFGYTITIQKGERSLTLY